MDIERLEKERKSAIFKCFITILLGIIASVIFIFITKFISFVVIVIMIVCLLIASGISNKYKNKFKNEIMPVAASTILKDVKFNAERGIARNLVAATQSMSTGDIFSSTNLITGKYKDVDVLMSDLHIQDESTDSDGDTTYTTIFLGQWLVFDFNKRFKANVQVWEKKLLGGISRVLFQGLKKVELEDIDFNKSFKVLSQNELEAFYIMTPNMMEKIKEVEKEVSGVLLLVFLDNKLHVGIKNGKTSFNVSLLSPINIEDFTNKCLRDLNAIIKFVDILDLDNDLFMTKDVESINNNQTETPRIQVETPTEVPVNNEVINTEVNNVDAVEYLNNLNNQ